MILSFGDVFRYQEEEYVYLIEVNDSVFAAKILDGAISALLRRRSEAVAKLPGKSSENLFSFVMLTTDGFKDRAAHLGASGANDGFCGLYQNISSLCSTDLENIKKEILESNGVPLVLKDFVKTL